ncbi:MAG TPA: hypothetical protein VHD56_04485 [Tepidisphaeraceae bacterium]|nr:hypothetical protein [Tepidisphaeraceae bacterium]
MDRTIVAAVNNRPGSYKHGSKARQYHSAKAVFRPEKSNERVIRSEFAGFESFCFGRLTVGIHCLAICQCSVRTTKPNEVQMFVLIGFFRKIGFDECRIPIRHELVRVIPSRPRHKENIQRINVTFYRDGARMEVLHGVITLYPGDAGHHRRLENHVRQRDEQRKDR